MPYAILRFQKRKAGGVAACERHNEQKKPTKATQISTWNALKNCHYDVFVAPPKYTYKKEINRKVAEAGCQDKERQRDDGGNAHQQAWPIL